MSINLIQKALDELHLRIPEAILKQVFIRRSPYERLLPVSIDTKIRELVIEARVMVDCNLVGGTLTDIPLNGLPPEYLSSSELVYRIPKNLTQNRTITAVRSVSVSNIYTAGTSGRDSRGDNASMLTSQLNNLVNAVAPIPQVSNAYVELIAENTILVRSSDISPINLTLNCLLANDAEFSNIKPANYHDWCKLVEFATKAYIYNDLIIKMDEGQLQGGVSLGRFREIVDSYSDSNELYDTHLKDSWRKTAFLNDTNSKRNHLRALMSRR